MSAGTGWSDENLRALYRGSTDEPARGSHPSEEDWVRLAADTLTADERFRLADHVVDCGECRAIFQAVHQVALDAPIVAASGAELSPAAASAAGQVDARGGQWRSSLALAASLLVAAAIGWWAWSLWTRVGVLELQLASARPAGEVAALETRLRGAEDRARELAGDLAVAREPGVNVPVVDLMPDAARGDGAEPVRIAFEPGARYVAFVITVTRGGSSRGPFSLEMLTADGRSVGRWDGLRPGPFGTSSMVVPAALLPAGRYTARVRDAADLVVQSHAMTVEVATGRATP